MTTDTLDLDDVRRRMESAFDSVKRDFAGLRTGRASVAMLDPVHVEAYGSRVPLNQVANVAVPEPRLLTVQVWDKSLVKVVEKGIREAALGLNPQPEGQLIRVPVPDLSQERRQELVRVAGKYAEQGRIAVRNVRRDAMDVIKKNHKDKAISDDILKTHSDQIQEITDETIKKIDAALIAREKELLTV